MAGTTSKNLGVAVAIIKGPSAPTNTDLLWLDTSSNPSVRKIYDPVSLAWIPWTSSSGGGGDNWGTQVVVSDTTLAGTGITANPLKIAQQAATTGQLLRWNGTTWAPSNESTVTGLATVAVDPAIFAGDGTGGSPVRLGPTADGFIPKWDQTLNGGTGGWKFAPDNIGITLTKQMMMLWSGPVAQIPAGWRLCDGNNGNPINGVIIPDLSGRFVVGYSAVDGDYNVIGASGGSKQVTLTTPQIPAHSHGVTDNGHTHNLGAGAGVVEVDGANHGISGGGHDGGSSPVTQTGSSQTGISIQNAGGGTAHENRPPYYTLAYIIFVDA